MNLLLGAFALRNIAADAEQSNHLTAGIAKRAFVGKVDPRHSPGCAGFLISSHRARRHHLAVLPHDLAAVFRSEEFCVIPADHFFRAAAEKPPARGINHQITPLQILHEDRVGCSLGNALQKRKIFFQLAGAHQQLVLHHKHAPTSGGERYRHQNNRPNKLFPGNAQDQGKNNGRDQQRSELSEQLHAAGGRANLLQIRLGFVPGRSGHGEQAISDGP